MCSIDVPRSIQAMTIDPSATIHPTSIVDEGATIGAESRVWHWVHISAGAVIGERCSFGQNVATLDCLVRSSYPQLHGIV